MSEPLVDVTGARRRRARQRLRRQLIIAGVIAGVLAVLGGAAWVVWGSPWLAAEQVEVTGTRLLTTEEVTGAAAVPLGGPLASVDTGAIERRVLEGTPLVESVRVGRSWPHTVTVDVTERVAVMALEVGSEFVWISPDGVAFHRSSEVPEGLLVAEGNLSDADVLAAMGRVAGALPEALRAEAVSIEASTLDSIVLTLADGRRVIWGSAEDNELKAQVIGPLLEVDAKEYDVSAPTHPTTR